VIGDVHDHADRFEALLRSLVTVSAPGRSVIVAR